MGDLVKVMNAVTDEEIDALMETYKASYDIATDKIDHIRYQAREEIAMKKMLDEQGCTLSGGFQSGAFRRRSRGRPPACGPPGSTPSPAPGYRCSPPLTAGVECWITAGGAHHTVLSYDVTAEQMKDWCTMMDIEFVHIGKDTTVESLEHDLFLSDLAWKLK